MEYNKKHTLIFFFIILSISMFCNAQDKENMNDGDEEFLIKDSLDRDSLMRNEDIKDKIDYSAKDSIVAYMSDNIVKLYDNSKLKYSDFDVDAAYVSVNWKNMSLLATGVKKKKKLDSKDKTKKNSKNKLLDKLSQKIGGNELKDSVENIQKTSDFSNVNRRTKGDIVQIPMFKIKGKKYISDTLNYNINTGKGLINSFKTEMKDGLLLGDIVKRESEKAIFIKNAKFTTDKKNENPDYYIGINRAKMIPGERMVTGPAMMWIADFPTLIWVPFLFFPTSQKRKSGIIVPKWGETKEQGVFLQDFGYYIPISDYFDIAIRGSAYSKGTWALKWNTNYKLLYKFSGSLSFNYDNVVYGERGRDDYSKSVVYNVSWVHSQDPKLSPTFRFSANVNFGSSEYYRNSEEQYDRDNFLQSSLNSSISISKRWFDSPFNLSMSLRHSQNTNTKMVNLTLPSLSFSMSTIFPFKSDTDVKEYFWDKIGMSYTMSMENTVNSPDSILFTKEMRMRNGMRHNIPISTNFKLFENIPLSLSSNYNQRWYLSTIKKRVVDGELLTDTVNRFATNMEFNLSSSLSTTIYGMFNFGKQYKVNAIRHLVKPSISFSYKPDFSTDFWGYYDKYIDNQGNEVIYSRFENSIYGGPSKGVQNSISFNVSNSIEAKVRKDKDNKKKDENEEPQNDNQKKSKKDDFEKIKIIDNLNISTSYNAAGDEFKLSNISISGGTNLLSKLNVNFNLTLDPYALDSQGQRINEFSISKNQGLARLTNFSLSFSYSYYSKNANSGGSNPNDNKQRSINSPFSYNFSVNYNFNYSKYSLNEANTASNTSFSGSLNIGKNWNVGFSSGYDFENGGFSYTSFNFARDLNSWTLRFNWVPLGRSFWKFFIGIKASILSDIKYEEQQRYRDRL